MATTQDLSLIDKLEQERLRLSISDRAFARKLGVSTTTWWNVKAGERELGRKSIGKVLGLFPHLEIDVLSYLREDEETGLESKAAA